MAFRRKNKKKVATTIDEPVREAVQGDVPVPPKGELAPLPEGAVHSPVTIAFFALLLIGSAMCVLLIFWSYVGDAFLAALFASMFLAPYRWMCRKLGKRRWIAAIAVCLLIVLLVAVPLTFLVTSLANEASHVFATAKDTVTPAKVEEWFFGEGWLARNVRIVASRIGVDYSPETLRRGSQNVVGAVAKFLYDQANVLIANVLKFLFHFLIMLLMVFYLLVDGRRLKEFLFRLSPLPDDEDNLLLDRFTTVGRGILLGNVVSALSQGLSCGVAMVVVGLPSPVLWGVVISILAFLPLVGSGLVTIPAAIILIANGHFWKGALFLAWCTGIGFLIDNVAKARLIGKQTEMHDFMVFLSVLGGISVFGFLGVLYGPLLVVLFTTLAELYEKRYNAPLAPKLRS